MWGGKLVNPLVDGADEFDEYNPVSVCEQVGPAASSTLVNTASLV